MAQRRPTRRQRYRCWTSFRRSVFHPVSASPGYRPVRDGRTPSGGPNRAARRYIVSVQGNGVPRCETKVSIPVRSKLTSGTARIERAVFLMVEPTEVNRPSRTPSRFSVRSRSSRRWPPAWWSVRSCRRSSRAPRRRRRSRTGVVENRPAYALAQFHERGPRRQVRRASRRLERDRRSRHRCTPGRSRRAGRRGRGRRPIRAASGDSTRRSRRRSGLRRVLPVRRTDRAAVAGPIDA